MSDAAVVGSKLDGPQIAAHRLLRPALPLVAITLVHAYFLAILLLGGGTKPDLFTDLILQAFAIVFLLLGLARLDYAWLSPAQRQLLLIAAGVAALPLLQLIPLPGVLLELLPGRGSPVDGQLQVAVASWRAFSLDPQATLAAYRGLLPAMALLIWLVQMRPEQIRSLGWAVLAAAVLMVPIGIGQVAGGPHSHLRPYLPTNPHDAVGLFANRNHYAALMVVAAVLAIAYARNLSQRFRRPIDRHVWIAAALMIASILLLGIVLSRSRAGFALIGMAMFVMLLLAFRNRREQPTEWRWQLAFTVLASLVAFQFGFLAVADRLMTFAGSDLRWDVAPLALGLAAEHAFLGLGIGTFPAAYAAYEPIGAVRSLYINHAHNDYLELLVDGGVLAMIVLIALVVWLVRRLKELPKLNREERQFRSAIFLCTAILLAHSFFDYPLRTTALSCVFVWLLAIVAADPTNALASSAPQRPRTRR